MKGGGANAGGLAVGPEREHLGQQVGTVDRQIEADVPHEGSAGRLVERAGEGRVLLNLRWNIELRQRGQSPFQMAMGAKASNLTPHLTTISGPSSVFLALKHASTGRCASTRMEVFDDPSDG